MYLKMSGEEAKKIIKKSGKSLTEIASKMGESPQNLNSMLKSSDIKTNVLSRIAKAMDVSIVFFFQENSLSLSPAESVSSSAVVLSDVQVPVYNIDVRAGMQGSTEVTIDDPQYIERYAFFDSAKKGDIAFHVTGQSMEPKYLAGSLVLVREVFSWQEYFGYGDCYVLLLKDGRRILKQIIKSEQDARLFVLCKSINPQYSAEELPRTMIARVFKVISYQTYETF